MIRPSKTLLCFVILFSSLSFCLSSFAVGNDSDKSYFTETDDFKVFTRNQIYLYEPCETSNEGVGDVSGDNDFGSNSNYLYVGGDSVEQKILSAGYSFGLTSSIPVGVLAGIQTLVSETTDLKNYNPLETIDGKIGYLKWSEDEFKNLKKVILSEPRFADYSETLKDFYDNPRNPSGNSDALDKLIAAEFFYYHYKYPNVNPGEKPQGDDKIIEDIQAAANIFIRARNSDLSVSTTTAEKFKHYYDDLENGTNYINESSLKINLKSADTANFLTSTLIIGDSLVYRSESDTEGSIDGKHYNGHAITGGNNAPLKGFATENIKAADGRTFAEGLEVLDNSSSSNIKYLIYALGNNNCKGEGNRCESSAPPLTETDLSGVVSKAREKFGENVYIFFLTSYHAVEGDGSDYGSLTELDNNVIVNNFASSDDKVRVINWASSVKSNPETYLYPDGHPKKAGSLLLGKLFRNALSDAQTDYEYDRDKAPCPDRADDREDVEVGSGEDGDSSLSDPPAGEDPPSDGGGSGFDEGTINDWFKIVKSRAKKYWMGQCGESFSSVQFSRDNICTDGCSVTAFSMVMSIYYDSKITPATTAALTGKWRTDPSTGAGVFSTMASNATKKGYNLRTSEIGGKSLTIAKTDALLKQKKMILINCAGGIPCAREGKTTSGHYFAVVGIDPSNPNNYIIANSHGKKPYKSTQSFSKSSVIKVINDRGGSGRVIWRQS